MIFKFFLVSLTFCGFAIAAPKENFEECKPIAIELMPIVEAINVTDRYLRTPEEYKAYADTCEKLIACFKAKDGLKIPEIDKKMSPCHFYIFYNHDFSDCAHKLIAKKDDNISCLKTLFNDIYEPEGDQCEQWDELQPCVKEQIGDFCDEKDLKEYEKQEKNIRVEVCELT